VRAGGAEVGSVEGRMRAGARDEDILAARAPCVVVFFLGRRKKKREDRERDEFLRQKQKKKVSRRPLSTLRSEKK
jgi:hypothetical protein